MTAREARYSGYSAAAVLITSGAVARVGLNPERELARVGMSLAHLQRSLVGLPPLLEDHWYRHLAATLRDDAAVLHLAERHHIVDSGLLGFYLQAQATVRAAILRMGEFTRTFNDSDIRIGRRGDFAALEVHALNPTYWTPAMAEARLRLAREFLRYIVVDPPVALRAVLSRQPAPAHAEAWTRSYGVPVRFGQAVDALCFDAKELERPLTHANPDLAVALGQALAAQASPPVGFGTCGQVRHALSVLLPGTRPSLQAVAQALKIPPALLKYELAKEGTTFRALLSEVRRDLVLHRLLNEPGVTVEQMADQLGYQDPSQFYRAFRQWTGTTVGEFRASAGRRRPIPASP